MFRGANAINLDSKGRLAIPTKHRQPLLDDCAGQLICTIDTQYIEFDQCGSNSIKYK